MIFWLLVLSSVLLPGHDSRDFQQFWDENGDLNLSCLEEFYESKQRQLGLVVLNDGRILQSSEVELLPSRNNMNEILKGIKGCPYVLAAITDASKKGLGSTRYILQTFDENARPNFYWDLIKIDYIYEYIGPMWWISITFGFVYFITVVIGYLKVSSKRTSGNREKILLNWLLDIDKKWEKQVIVPVAFTCFFVLTAFHAILIYAFGGITNAPVSLAVGYSLIMMSGIVARRYKECRKATEPLFPVIPSGLMLLVCSGIVGYSIFEAYSIEGAARGVLLTHYAGTKNIIMFGVTVVIGSISHFGSSFLDPTRN